MKQRMEKKKQMKTSPSSQPAPSAVIHVSAVSGLAATQPPSSPRLPPLPTWPPSRHPGGSLSPRLAGQTPPSLSIKILHGENHTKLVVLPERGEVACKECGYWQMRGGGDAVVDGGVTVVIECVDRLSEQIRSHEQGRKYMVAPAASTHSVN
nr:hypothetical protein Iba_chr14eCG6750 [Ipomoea batatas]